MASLDGKVALITGSGRGMGRVQAVVMAARSADIVVTDINGDGAAETREMVRANGREAMVCVTDVADPKGMSEAVAEAERRFGHIDILVNNAGIGAERTGIEGVGEEWFQRTFDIHVKGTFFTTQAVVPGMKSRRSGSIINVSSIWAMTGHEFGSTYTGAKAAILGLTKAWAKELAPYNICVNAIAPGGVTSPMAIEKDGMDAVRQRMKEVPLGRWAAPEEIAYSVAVLASSEAHFITGQVISQSGDQTIVGI